MLLSVHWSLGTWSEFVGLHQTHSIAFLSKHIACLQQVIIEITTFNSINEKSIFRFIFHLEVI